MIKFDPARHLEYLNAPIDYPRINQFAEWFTVKSEQDYVISENAKSEPMVIIGKDLIDGFTVNLGKSR